MGYRQGKNPFSKSPLNFSSPLNSFDSLVGKLMNQGKSKEAATKIAGKVANAKMKGAGSGPTAAQKARSKGSAAKMADESPLDKELVGNQKNLPDHLKNAIEAAPESPAKMKSPIKAHGKKLKALEKRIEKVRKSKEGSEGQGGIDYELLSELEAQKKQMIESHDKQAKETKDSPAKMSEKAAKRKAKKGKGFISQKTGGKDTEKRFTKLTRKGRKEMEETGMVSSNEMKKSRKIKSSPAKMKDGRTGKSHSEMSDKEKEKHIVQHKGTGARKRKKPTRPEASKRTADQLNAKDPIGKKKGSPAKSYSKGASGHGYTEGQYEKHKEQSIVKQSPKHVAAHSGSEGNKKKSPLNNAYENPQYIQPTKSSYGQDMDNFFNTVDNAFSEANTPEARSERNTRRSKIIEDKLKDSPNDEKLKKKSDRLAAERVGIDSRIASQSFNVDNLSNEDLNNLYEAIKNRK